MLVVVKDKEGREVASHLDVTSITIDTSVTRGAVIEVHSENAQPAPAYRVTTAISLNDIITADKQPAT